MPFNEAGFLARFLARARFNLDSSFRQASFEIVNNLRVALSIRSASISPGTFGGGNGFTMLASLLMVHEGF